MKIETCIIDDDPFIRQELQDELNQHYKDEIKIIGVYGQAEDALEALSAHPPQLVFLDIQMPGMNGFELLDRLGDVSFEVIFITSFNQYAIQAIRYSALDYLLKPIDRTELGKAIERFKSIADKALLQSRLQNLRHNLKASHEKDFQLIIPTKQGEYQFAAGDIIRCEADSNYTVLYLTKSKKFVASKTLGDIEAMLNPESFLRVHKTHLVHLAHVDRLNTEGELILKDGSHIPVSRRRLTEVKVMLSTRKS